MNNKYCDNICRYRIDYNCKCRICSNLKPNEIIRGYYCKCNLLKSYTGTYHSYLLSITFGNDCDNFELDWIKNICSK